KIDNKSSQSGWPPITQSSPRHCTNPARTPLRAGFIFTRVGLGPPDQAPRGGNLTSTCDEARRIAANIAKLPEAVADGAVTSGWLTATQGHSQPSCRWPCKQPSQRQL